MEIQPWFWLGTGFIGGLTDVKTSQGLQMVLIFVFVAAISVLVHEFGHALTGRRLGGGRPSIVLVTFGGYAQNQGARFTRDSLLWMIAMGPGAGFLLLIAVSLLVVLFMGPQDGLSMIRFALFPGSGIPTENVALLYFNRLPLFWLIHSFLWVNFWWGVLNLLPIVPLDGGRIMELFVRPQNRVHQIGLITAAAVAAYGLLVMKSNFTAIMFGFFAYQNYKAMDQYRR